MKARPQPTKKQLKICKDAVDAYWAESALQHETDIDSAILWVVHLCYGSKKKKLREFYDLFRKVHKELAEWYEMPHETPFICRMKLKEIGVDVEAWNKEG